MKVRLLFVCITFHLISKTLPFLNKTQRRRYEGKKFNVCRKRLCYVTGATNPNECWYNPDVDSFAPDIIKRYGYSFESYKVTSDDGYITTLFRIPRGKTRDSSNSTNNRQPIFLLHGLATSSHNMVGIGKRCLAFALSDAGYDVWLGNMRGNFYSLGHSKMTFRNPDYWTFSFHEMGKYDMPVTFELISKRTHGKKIIFVGHSLAASVFHVFETYHREMSKNYLAGAVLVAPVVYLTEVQPPHPELERFGNPIMILSALLGVKGNSTDVQQVLSCKRTLCQDLPLMLQPYISGLYLAFGLRSPNIPPHHLPLLLAHNPSGFSVNTLIHLLQISRNDGVFQEYDYGVAKNQEIYDDAFPREYDIQGCETPVIVFYGENDWISTEPDVEKLLSTISKDKVKGKYKIKANTWKHLDYFYGKHLNSLFYKPLLDSLKEFTNDSAAEIKSNEKCDSKTTNNTGGDGSEAVRPNTNEANSTTKHPLVITTPPSKVASINNLATFGTPSTLSPNPKPIPKTTSKTECNKNLVIINILPGASSNPKIPTKSSSTTSSYNNLATCSPLSTLYTNPQVRTTSKQTGNSDFSTFGAVSISLPNSKVTTSKTASNNNLVTLGSVSTSKAININNLPTYTLPTLFPNPIYRSYTEKTK